MTKIAFIGLGHMGLPMATNLLKAGYDVIGFDIMPQSLQAFTGSKGQDIPTTVLNADVVISMLPEGKHVRSAYEGPEGILAHVKPETLVAECSTIDIESSRHIHSQAEALNIHLVDAPVSGGVAGATAASITFMVGGKRKDFDALHPFFEAMGKIIIYCGEAGLGQAAKICNNLILGVTMIGVSEAFNLAEQLGLDKQVFFDVTTQSSAQCWSISNYCPVPGPVPSSPANRDYAAGFTAAMMLKDLKLAAQAAQLTSTSLPLSTEALALYTRFCNTGKQSIDFSGIIQFLKNK